MLQNPPFLHNSLKLVKYSETLASPASTQEELIPSKQKIQPIPILHTKLQNNKNLKRKFIVHGHKYHANISASGTETSQVLYGIKRSSGLKFVRNFEFDPYLCDESHLDLLSKALTKLKYTKGINLVIRRLQKSDEVKKMTSNVIRLQRLERLRLELPRTQNINDQALMDFGNMISKCYSLKEIDNSTLNLENISESAHLKSSKKSKKLVHVRKIKRAMQKTEISNDICNFSSVQRSTFNRLHIQSIDLSFGIPTGWCSMSTEVDETAMLVLRTLAWHQELKSLKLQFTGNPAVFETMQVLGETIPKIQSLKRFSLELLNSKVTESEMFAMIQMIPNITQIEEFTFKVIQYPNVETAWILCLISKLSQFKNFKKINLYFRRMVIDEDKMREVVNRIQGFNEMSCIPSKNSLYIYKKMCDEDISEKNQLNFEEILS
jgi:hypothetical protein